MFVEGLLANVPVDRYRIAARFYELRNDGQRNIDYLYKAYCVDTICYGAEHPHVASANDALYAATERVKMVLSGWRLSC